MSSQAGPPIGNVGVAILAVTWVFFGISLVVVCLRLYADILIVRQIRLDSYLTFITFVSLYSVHSLSKRGILTQPT